MALLLRRVGPSLRTSTSKANPVVSSRQVLVGLALQLALLPACGLLWEINLLLLSLCRTISRNWVGVGQVENHWLNDVLLLLR